MLVFGFCYCDSDKRQYFSTLSEDFVNENHLARVNLNIILTNYFLLEDVSSQGLLIGSNPAVKTWGLF